MQKPNKKPAKSADEPAKSSRIKPQDFPHALEKFEDKLIQLGMEFETLEKEAYPKVKAVIDGALPKMEGLIASLCMYHHDRIQQALMEHLHEFLKTSPFYETRFVPGVHAIRSEVEALYRAGWRYGTTVHDDKAGVGGTLYVRPKVPKDFDDFAKMYKDVMLAKNKIPDSLKKRSEYYDAQAAKNAMKKGKPLSKDKSALTKPEPEDEAEPAEAEDEVAAVVEEEEATPVTTNTKVKKVLVKIRPKAKS